MPRTVRRHSDPGAGGKTPGVAAKSRTLRHSTTRAVGATEPKVGSLNLSGRVARLPAQPACSAATPGRRNPKSPRTEEDDHGEHQAGPGGSQERETRPAGRNPEAHDRK